MVVRLYSKGVVGFGRGKEVGFSKYAHIMCNVHLALYEKIPFFMQCKNFQCLLGIMLKEPEYCDCKDCFCRMNVPYFNFNHRYYLNEGVLRQMNNELPTTAKLNEVGRIITYFSVDQSDNVSSPIFCNLDYSHTCERKETKGYYDLK